jgi:hypothetical protein
VSGNLFDPDDVFRALSATADNDIDMDGEGHYYLEIASWFGGRGLFTVIDTREDEKVVERYLVMIQRDPTFDPEGTTP